MTREALQQLRELLQEQSKGLTELMDAKLQEQRNDLQARMNDRFDILEAAVKYHGNERICVFWMGQSYPAGLFKDIEHRYPKLTGGFHANIVTVVFGKPVSQFLQAFCKGGKASLLILCTSICVSNSDTGVNPGLVNIQSTAVFAKNLKCHSIPPNCRLEEYGSDWSSGKIESI